jgi:hypothetical protein
MQLKPRWRVLGQTSAAVGFIASISSVIVNWLSIDSSKNKLEPALSRLHDLATNGHTIVAVLGAAMLAILFYRLSRGAAELPPFVIRMKARGDEAYWATPADALNVWRLCASYYDRPDQVIGYGPLKTFIEARKETALIVRSKNPQERCGLFVVFALNSAGVRAINSKQIESAQELKREHAALDGDKAQGLYVTNICGKDSLWMSAVVEHELYYHLYMQVVSIKNDIQWVYGRRGHRDGARLMDKSGFKPTRPKDPELQIWRLSRRGFLAKFKKRFEWKGGTGLRMVNHLAGWYDHPRLPAAPTAQTQSTQETDSSFSPITGLS